MRAFSIPGKPTPKARARTTKAGVTFTPKPTQLAEGKVLECYLAAYPDAPPYEGAVELSVMVYFSIPPSWSKKKAAAAKDAPHVSRPDLDNIIKMVTDALNGVAFKDDSQISYITAMKNYGTKEGVVVRLVEGDTSAVS